MKKIKQDRKEGARKKEKVDSDFSQEMIIIWPLNAVAILAVGYALQHSNGLTQNMPLVIITLIFLR